MDFYRLSFGCKDDIPVTQKNIVLDLDETLLHTFVPLDSEDERSPTAGHHGYAWDEFDFIFHDNRYFHHKSRLYFLDIKRVERKYGDTKDLESYWGFYRPYLKDFLIFCRQYFNKVIIWTAGMNAYGRGICDVMFNDLYQPDLILTRDDCVHKSSRSYHKPLNKIYNLPQFKGIVTQENTLILDDKKSNFRDNPHNGIVIEPFDPEDDGISIKEWLNIPDTRLLEFRDWLLRDDVIRCRDVRSLDKSNIFSKR